MPQLALTQWAEGAAPPGDAFTGALSSSLARELKVTPERVEVRYRRYTTLKSTARIAADGRLVVTLSEDTRLEPPLVRAAIANVLAARVLGRRPAEWAAKAYDAWLADPRTRELSLRVRAARARRRTRGPVGRHHNLLPLLYEVAARNFTPALPPPPVGWTEHAGRAVLASFDEAHGIITVSRLLDHARVKPHTLRYLLYHEMLHYEDFLRERDGGASPGRTRHARRRSIHPPSFTQRLHAFPGWRLAEDDLARAVRRRAVD